MTRAVAMLAVTPLCVLGCRAAEDAGNKQAAAVAAPTVGAEPSPAQRAERLVRQQLGAENIRFASPDVFTSGGATIVCGRYQRSGEPPARYIATGDDDLFVEGRMRPGHMDQAVTEFCRNA